VVPSLRIAYDMAVETAAAEQPPPERPSRKKPSDLRILIGTVGLGAIAGFSTVLFLRAPGPVVVFAMGFSWAAAVTALWFAVRRSAGPESPALARERSRTHLSLVSGRPRRIRVAKPATEDPQPGGATVSRAAKLRR
ncbi:MAG TPA: hypothetical protein VI893_04680, partial [Thermoplasmata archaeon]|nr:hypothetical protein [Thermoplasmata archaeon]